MKQIITLALILGLFSFKVVAQTPKPEGVGKFKINKTNITIIQELEKELSVKCKKVVNRKEQNDEKKNDFYFIELSDSIIKNIYCLKVRVFEIKTYKINEIEFKDLMLIFHNNTLVSLSSQANEDIDKAFELKYGAGKFITKREKTDCTRFFENSYSYETWLNNDISTILSYRHYKDDDSCEEIYDYSLFIFSKSHNKKENDCIIQKEATIELKRRKKELERIKDF